MRSSEAEAIWGYRNALVHSFGFHSVAAGRVIPLHMYQADGPAPVVSQRHDGWELSVDDLYEMLILTIRRYELLLRTNLDLQNSFEAAWDDYGRVYVRGPHLP